MRSAVTRRLVTASLPLAALSAASLQAIASSANPDAELLRLDDLLSAAWARQAAAEAELNVADQLASGDAPWVAFDRLFDETLAIVRQIETLPATTLAGLIVKARACHWCHGGKPVDKTFFDNEPTTDSRLAAGILGDLLALDQRLA